MNFKLLQFLVSELNSSNSTLDKTRTLSKPEYDDDFIKKVLVATHNPFIQYYVTSKNLIKRSDLCSPNDLDFFELLDKLSSRVLSGHDALATVNGFIENHKEYAELIYNVLDRNLKTRTGDKIINKVFPKLIPTYNVPLAKKYEEHMKKVKFDIDSWFASRKLDGLRCTAIIDALGVVTLRSREGNEFLTLDKVKAEIRKLNLISTVFDGEICIIDDDGTENFPAIQREFNKKNHTIAKPRYKIFDMVTLEEFEAEKGDRILSIRIKELNELFLIKDDIIEETNILSLLEQTLVRDEAHLQELRDEAKELGWEGIMLRMDIGYEGKRSNKLLKCKLFEEDEFEVVGVLNGPMRVIVKDDDGKTREITEEMLSKAIILYEGEEVGVGSGWSQEQRRHYYNHPEELIGNEITVQYFEVSQDKTGKKSLRFPTVKAVWDGKRNV